MAKVVINRCFGGFGLSDKALRRYGQIKGVEVLSEDKNGLFPVYYYMEEGRRNDFYDRDIPRDDLALVQVVEELGDEAGDNFSYLVVEELAPGTRYYIDEYDGMETVVTEADVKWSVA